MITSNMSDLDEGSPEINKRLLSTNNIYWKYFSLNCLETDVSEDLPPSSVIKRINERGKIFRNIGFETIKGKIFPINIICCK